MLMGSLWGFCPGGLAGGQGSFLLGPEPEGQSSRCRGGAGGTGEGRMRGYGCPGNLSRTQLWAAEARRL